jgi:hypothetical protein
VELAVCLPALVMMLYVALTAVNAVRLQAQCFDAAREAALAAERGEDAAAAGARDAPAGAVVAVVVGTDTVTATVRVHITPLGGALPGFDISGDAEAALEPGVG